MASSGKEIFVSYGREPEVSAFVKKLKLDMEARGFSVWLDTDDIPAGSDWHGAIGILKHILNMYSRLVIVLQALLCSRAKHWLLSSQTSTSTLNFAPMNSTQPTVTKNKFFLSFSKILISMQAKEQEE